MTTIAANLKEIAADTRVSWDGVGSDVFSALKIFPAKGAWYGISGENCTGSMIVLDWFREGAPRDFRPTPPEFDHGWDWKILELSPEGIGIYNECLERDLILQPAMAIGSGAKIAMFCMLELKMSPPEAVRMACRYDHHSEVPIYHAKLGEQMVHRWTPPKKPKKGRKSS